MSGQKNEPAFFHPPPPNRSPLRLLLVIGLGFGFLHLVFATCPTDCVCKWKNGKQTVECVNRSLRTFPGPIDPTTQVLDVSGNSFEMLPHDNFMRLGLTNLQKIYLSKCRLSLINSKAFRGLSNLVELDLSYNVMREVPGAAFPDCQGLMKLFLNGNPIALVQKNVFSALNLLTHLEMSHCGIEVIEKGAFYGLNELKWLKINGNKLRRMSGLQTLPTKMLIGVWLEDNPWECDCRLLELRLWLGERNVANSMEPRCAQPDRLTNCTLRELTVENFACTPELSPTTMYQKIDEGKNVSLLCKVTSTPESSLEWLFNGKLLSNNSLNMLIETTSSFVSGPSPISPTSSGGSQGNNGGLASPASTSTSSTMSMSLSVMSTGQGSSSFTGLAEGTKSERKSELLILNATSEENGTFTCMAQNPAGVAMANFTLRVLMAREEVEVSGNGLTSFVSHYPNLIIIVLSTGAVIGVVIVICVIVVCICKCCRMCGNKPRRGESSPETTGEGRRPKSKRKSKGESAKDAKEVTTMNSVVSSLAGCGGKLDRHLSETSTLTTHTKSNGSVFLLSTSSELGLGDSNPDLIEGVRRLEGDGHDHLYYKNNGSYSVNSGTEPQAAASSSASTSHSQQTLPKQKQKQTQVNSGGPSSSASMTLQQHHHHTQTHYSPPNPATIEPPPFNAYPVDYGLPKSLNVSTLVRRSPSYPMTPTTTIPPTYDLAKYPKEYISPQQPPQPLSSSPTYGYPHSPTSNPHYIHSHEHVSQGSPPSSKSDYYPTTYILPQGAYVTTYNGPSGEEYTVTMDKFHTHTHNGVPGSCTCMPILEGNESEEKSDEGSVPPPPPPISPSRKHTMIKYHGHCHGHPHPHFQMTQEQQQQLSQPSSPLPPSHISECDSPNLMISSSTSTTNLGGACSGVSIGAGGGSGGGSGSCSLKSASGMGQPNVNARLHRQLTTQINESPDEGYEDESAEGTEI